LVFKGFDPGFYFQDGITEGGHAVALVGLGKKFGFDDAGPVGQAQEFHRLAGDLMMDALLHDQAAGGHGVTDEFAQAADGAVGVPGDVWKQFEGMSAHGETEEIRFPLETFQAGWLLEREGGPLFQSRRGNQPALIRLMTRAKGFEEMLRLPELAGAGFAEFIEAA